MILSRFKPAVPKCWMFDASGVMWSGVGMMMCVNGASWLACEGLFEVAGVGLVGLSLAVLAFRWGFGGIARKNIRRLRRLPVRVCFFGFQTWKRYLFIMFMIGLGVAMRRSPIPRRLVAVVYITIGGALFLGSFHYHRHLVRLMCTVHRSRFKH